MNFEEHNNVPVAELPEYAVISVQIDKDIYIKIIIIIELISTRSFTQNTKYSIQHKNQRESNQFSN